LIALCRKLYGAIETGLKLASPGPGSRFPETCAKLLELKPKNTYNAMPPVEGVAEQVFLVQYAERLVLHALLGV
jgi:hypothetical protein